MDRRIVSNPAASDGTPCHERLADAFLARTEELDKAKDREPLTEIVAARRLRSELREIEQGSLGKAVMRYVKLRGEPLKISTQRGEIQVTMRDFLGPEFDKVMRYSYSLLLTAEGFRVHKEVDRAYANGGSFRPMYQEWESLDTVSVSNTGTIIDQPGVVTRILTVCGIGARGKAIRIPSLIALQRAGITLEKVQHFLHATLERAACEHAPDLG